MPMPGAKPQAAGITTASEPDERWPPGFWPAVLKVVLTAAVVAALFSRLDRLSQREGKKDAAAAGSDGSRDQSPVPRLVPKLAGANGTSTLPPLIYRRAEDEPGKLWLRPEGGGRLLAASAGATFPLTDAVSYYDARVAASPGDPDLLTLRAMIRLDLGQPARAIRDCDAAIRQDPNRAWAYYFRGLARLGRGDAGKALADIDRAIQLDGSLERPHWARGRVLLHKNDPKGAVGSFGKAIELEPKFAAAYRDRAAAWMLGDQPDRAAADIDRALHLDPKDPMAYCIRGRIRAIRDAWSEALGDFKNALALNPYLARAYLDRGNGRLRRKEYAEALRDIEQAVHLDPELLFEFSSSHSEHGKGHPEQAVADFTELIRLDPQTVVARCARGSALLGLRRFDAAIQDLDMAIVIDPRRVFARYERAVARAKWVDRKQAMEDFETARRMDPQHAQEYAGRLEEVRQRASASPTRTSS
ncbi:MAG: tetratricopeptide repeat protein [Isosphaeraceae bacterium]